MKALTRKKTIRIINRMPKNWTQIRIEKDTAKELDKIHIERREAYNDIIIRLVKFWQDNPDTVKEWLENR